MSGSTLIVEASDERWRQYADFARSLGNEPFRASTRVEASELLSTRKFSNVYLWGIDCSHSLAIHHLKQALGKTPKRRAS